MPTKDLKGAHARKTVAERFRIFVAIMLQQFSTPPEKLVERAEKKAAKQSGGSQE